MILTKRVIINNLLTITLNNPVL